ncbi:hypothetical protein HK098_003718 [Nowakowskiella sp. JEL0407]|nr:hypothetical protein HK098_003718 [Nowakowskiella sp. JEL0407]
MYVSSSFFLLALLSQCRHVLSQSQNNVTLCQKSIIQQVTNFYEYKRKAYAYDYCANIGDGRGYSSGIIGFTTATHDALLVIQLYKSKSSQNTEFDKYLPTLIKIDQTGTSSTDGLDGYCKIWYNTCQKEDFRKAQLEIAENLYWYPSQNFSDKIGLVSALARGQMFDAFIQHGYTNTDKDSAIGMTNQTESILLSKNQSTPLRYGSEITWLTEFLKVRENTLTNPQNPATRDGFRASLWRVKSYQFSLSYLINITTIALNNTGGNITDRALLSFDNELVILDDKGQKAYIPCDLNIWTQNVGYMYIPPNNDLSVGAIMGIVVGGLCLVAICVVLFWCRKRISKKLKVYKVIR